MTKHDFKVIKGGHDTGRSKASYRFFSAYVTDTRLMGVLTLYIHWKTDINDYSDFHQFFYFDAEEYGLETYKSMWGNDEISLNLIEQGLIGGLGGKKVSVSEKEARYLAQSFVALNKKLNSPQPGQKSEYEFLINMPIKLTEKEQQNLVNKICTPILSNYQLIHYFLMRCFARDEECISYLSIGHMDLDLIAEARPTTLCKNSIEEYEDENENKSYLCEALIELDNKYSIILIEVTTEDGKIKCAKRRSSFRITSAEAAMMLNRPEFVTLYEILTDPEDFDERLLPLVKSAMQTNHDNGRLYLEFNKDNDHVNQKVFRLNEDILGLYYVSDYGQLILAAYSLEAIRSLEKSLQKSSLASGIMIAAKYEFKEPILYEFIQSDFDDFSDFLESLK